MWLYVLFFVIIALLVLTAVIRVVIRTTVYYDHVPDLHGRTIVITGASSGLGLQLTEILCKKGARVISIHRYLDDINFVQQFATELARTEERIDCVVNNAGILCSQTLSPDGLDKMMAVNYVGHFLLTKILIPKMRLTPEGLGRIINITCGSFTSGNLHLLFDMERKEQNEASYDIQEWYRSSKLGLYLMSREFGKRFKFSGLCCLCVDPGLLATTFYSRLPQPQRSVWCLLAMLMFRTTEEGAQSVLFSLFDQKVQSCSGMVIKDCKVYDPQDADFLRKTRSVNMSERVWDITEQLIENKLDKLANESQANACHSVFDVNVVAQGRTNDDRLSLDVIPEYGKPN